MKHPAHTGEKIEIELEILPGSDDAPNGDTAVTVVATGGGSETLAAAPPSILPLVTPEIRDDHRRHLEMLRTKSPGDHMRRLPKNRTAGIPVFFLVFLVGFAIGVIAYAVVIHRRSPYDDNDRFQPPYASSPTLSAEGD